MSSLEHLVLGNRLAERLAVVTDDHLVQIGRGIQRDVQLFGATLNNLESARTRTLALKPASKLPDDDYAATLKTTGKITLPALRQRFATIRTRAEAWLSDPTVKSATRPPPPTPPADDGVIVFYGTDAGITSDADRAISFRNQEHSWYTSDGVLHTIVNRGSKNGAGLALTLYTRTGPGPYVQQLTIPRTDENSTSDGFFVGNELWLAYSAQAQDGLSAGVGHAGTSLTGGSASATGNSSVLFSRLKWDGSSWTLLTTETVFASPTLRAEAPSIVLDDAGAVWCAFPVISNDNSLKTIRMMRRNISGVSTPQGTVCAWLDIGRTFGTGSAQPTVPADAIPFPGRIARLFRLATASPGIALLYTQPNGTGIFTHYYWYATHVTGASLTTWNDDQIYEAAIDKDPEGGHFNIVVDAAGNAHLLFADWGSDSSGHLVYKKLTLNVGWSAVAGLTPAISAVYVQGSILPDGRLVAATNDSNSFIWVFESTDGGATWTHTKTLRHPPADQYVGATYPNPRIEIPAGLTNASAPHSPLPFLLQYTNPSGDQALMRFY